MSFRFEIDEFIQHRSEREFTFPLHASSIGRKALFKAKVRRLNLMDRATIGHLPDHLQNDVWKQLRAASREIEQARDAGRDPQNITEALANNDAMLNLANIFCRYGFVEPSLTLNAREEDLASGVLHVDRIAPEDRIAYMWACNDADSEQARYFATFRDEARADVPDRQDGEVLGREALRPVGDARGGVRFGDPV